MLENLKKKLSALSTTAKVTLYSILTYAIVLTALELLVVDFHRDFVSQFTLSVQGKGISTADLIYHAIFILSLVFQVLLCIDALWGKNSMQLIALVVFNILSLCYAGVQLYQHVILEDDGTAGAPFNPTEYPDKDTAKAHFKRKVRPLEYVIIGSVTAFSGYLAILSFKLMKEFGWELYRKYSADVRIRNAFRSLMILQTLIKLDIFFIGSFAIQLIPSQSIGYSDSSTEIILIFLVGTLMLMLAWYSIVRESKYTLLSVINMLLLSIVYMTYRLITINLPRGLDDPYRFTKRLLSFSLAVTISLVLASVFYALKCFRNMMRGDYVFTVYGLPGERQQQNDPFDDYKIALGVDRNSKRASKMAEVAQLSNRRISIDS